MSYNMHVLTHVTEFVRYWGAPWAYSAFMYEDVGGWLKRHCHGSRQISNQIFHNFLMEGKMRAYAMHYIDNNTHPQISSLYKRLDPKFATDSKRMMSFNSRHSLTPFFFGFDGTLNGNQDNELFENLQISLGEPLNTSCFSMNSYSRVLINGQVYTTKKYSEKLRRDNSLVQLKVRKEVFQIEYIYEVMRNCMCNPRSQHVSCKIPINTLFKKGHKVLFVGDKISLKSLSPYVVPYANNFDLNSFLRKVVPSSKKSSKGFFEYEIEYKCSFITACNLKTKDDYCIVNDVVFENS